MCVTKYDASFDFFSQALKHVDAILGLLAIQKQAAGQMGLWAIVCRPLWRGGWDEPRGMRWAGRWKRQHQEASVGAQAVVHSTREGEGDRG